MFTIGIYPRKSVYRDNSDSVQVQVQLCKDYAAIIYKDREISFRVYDKDEGFSGKNTKRPSFQDMMDDVRNDLLDAVMVYKLDRISRNVQEFSAMYDVFQKHKVAFVSVKESFDTSTPMGRTVMYILAAFAQLERENTSERVADGMLALGAAGKWTGGTRPCGMTSIRKKNGSKEHSYLVVDKASIWLPKLLYRLILDGYPITRIERYCRDHNIRSANDKFLGSSQIYNILSNPVYCQNSTEAWYYFRDLGCSLPDIASFDGTKGLIAYGKTKTGQGQSQPRQDCSCWTIAVGIHEPVISAQEWIATQQRLGINKQVRKAKYEVGVLKGVLCCSCGQRMEVRTYKKNNIVFSYYFCPKMARWGHEVCDTGYVRIEIIERLFWDKLRDIRLNPDTLNHYQVQNADVRKAADIQSDIAKIEKSIHNLTEALAQATDTSASPYIIKEIADYDKRKAQLDADYRAAVLAESAATTASEENRRVYDSICYLLDNFDQIDYSGKNELIRKITKKCIYDGQKLTILF